VTVLDDHRHRPSSVLTIADLRATTVTVPLEAPLRHAAGAHWGRFVRTIVEVETTDGIIGLGELGGGGQSAQLTVQALGPRLVGHNVFDLTALWFKICNPTAALYDNRLQVHAAIEFACLDIIGQALDVPVYDLLGGKLRDAVPFASYLFFRYPDPATGRGEVRTPDQLVAQALELKERHGFSAHKLKAGVFPPEYELECFRAIAAALPEDSLRIDPNASYSVPQAIRVGRAIKDLRNDYYEDPTWGMNGLRHVREATGLPIATNTVVTNMEQLAANVRDPAVDVVLLRHDVLGGHPAHPEGRSGMRDVPARHRGALIGRARCPARHHAPPRSRAAVAAVRGRRPLPSPRGRCHRGGQAALPPRHDRSPSGARAGGPPRSRAAARYARLYEELGDYPYDQDPGRPGWYARVPNEEWADPYAAAPVGWATGRKTRDTSTGGRS